MNNDRDDGCCWCRGEDILNVCTMPGANCCLPQCTKSGYKRKIPLPEENEDENIHFFQITTRKSKFYTEMKHGARMIRVSGPVIWNRLPTEIQDSPSLPTFKIRLKKHLLTDN